jgi:hypothetical protein
MGEAESSVAERYRFDRRDVLLAVAVGLMFGLVQFRPIHDVDMFWQVKSGEMILDTGRLPTTDPFTSTHFGDPNPQIYWLSQVAYAGLTRVAGWEFLHALDSLAFALAFWLAANAGRAYPTRPLADLAAVAVAFLVAMPHHGLRPQTIGLLGFAAVMRVEAASIRPWVKTVILAGVVVVWQNCHPSASMAVVYLGAKAAAAWWRWWLTGQGTAWPLWPTAYPVVALVLLPLTPTGFQLFGLSAANAEIARQIGIEEWLPVWDRATWPAAKSVCLAAVLTVSLLAYLGRRTRADDVLVCLVFTIGALAVYRLSLFWAVAMIPVWARWLEAARPPGFFDLSPERWRAVPAGAVVLAAWALAGAGSFVAGAPLFDPSVPLTGVRRVAELNVSGVVYNYREWGGPLIWADYPRVRVTIDGRLYLYPRESWVAYDREASGAVPLEDIEARYHPDAFFLRPSYHGPLIELVRASGRWDEAYRDDSCVLFLPRAGTQKQPPDHLASASVGGPSGAKP